GARPAALPAPGGRALARLGVLGARRHRQPLLARRGGRRRTRRSRRLARAPAGGRAAPPARAGRGRRAPPPHVLVAARVTRRLATRRSVQAPRGRSVSAPICSRSPG